LAARSRNYDQIEMLVLSREYCGVKVLCLTAARQCGKMRPDELIDDYPDDFTLAALAKQAAFPPWLTLHQILNDVGP